VVALSIARADRNSRKAHKGLQEVYARWRDLAVEREALDRKIIDYRDVLPPHVAWAGKNLYEESDIDKAVVGYPLEAIEIARQHLKGLLAAKIAEYDRYLSDPGLVLWESRMERLDSEIAKLETQIADLPAGSSEDVAAKVHVFMKQSANDLNTTNGYPRCGLSLMRDIRRLIPSVGFEDMKAELTDEEWIISLDKRSA
jgi:hypothetical protein